MTRRRRALNLWLVLVSATVGAACSDDPPEVSAPPSSPLPSVEVSSPTKDGETADPAKVAVVVARLTDPSRIAVPVGLDGLRAYYRLQMLGLGLTDAEANCAADRLVDAAGPDAGTKSLGEVAAGSVGVDPVALSQCLTPDRLGQLASIAPDLAAVPPAEVRAFLASTGLAALRSSGLASDEAECIVEALVGDLPDEQLAGLFAGATTIDDRYPEAVASCLTAARIDELAET